MPPFVTTRAFLRAAGPERADEQPLVVTELILTAPIRVCGVEDSHTRPGGGSDRLVGELLVMALVRRQAHAPESNAELRRVKPFRTTQGT